MPNALFVKGEKILLKINKIVNGIINLVFYPAVAAIVVMAVLFVCGIKPYITMSGSMEPEIQTGSVCFVNTKAEYSQMQVGNVIAYQTSAGGLVTHRIISVTSEGLETKGDNNDMSDGVSTTSENFRGETLFSVPFVGYVLKALQQPRNLAIVSILVIGIFLYNMIDSYWEKKDEEISEESGEIEQSSRFARRKCGKYEK